MKIDIIFYDGTRLPITERADYNKPTSQKIMRAHKCDPLHGRCSCRDDIELLMDIAFAPREPDDASPGGSPVEDGAGAGAIPLTVSAEERVVDFRRDPKTSGLHPEGCPNSLVRRDRTKELRGDRKYPVSLFGPPRQRDKSQPCEFRNGGASAGSNLGKYADFCNVVLNAATHKAALMSGEPFGTPTTRMLFSSVTSVITDFRDLAEPSLSPFEAAETKGCRLEFGLCEYQGFGRPFNGVGGIMPLPVMIANENGELRPGSYLMDAVTYAAAAKHIHRYNVPLSPPFAWIGVISSSGRYVRFWQWPAAISLGKILIVDSDPEADFAAEELLNGQAVYKVRSIEDGNRLLHLLVPEAGPLLSKCDFIIWDGRVATIVEVVKHGEDDEMIPKPIAETSPGGAQHPSSDLASKKSVVERRRYWRRLKRKETQKGGYHDLEIRGKLKYKRADMGTQLSLWRNS